MKTISYQQKAVKELSAKVVELLDINSKRQKIVFKAPTGSGKTYMTAMAMEQVADMVSGEMSHQYEKVAYVWIAPNRLHSQAYESLSKLFEETRSLQPILFDGISDGQLKHGEVLCLNWGSLHSEDNILVRDTEQGKSLWDIIETTREKGTAIVAIIDEEHLHWDAKADRAATVLKKLSPIVEIRVSATPKTITPYNIVVHRKDVVEAQMIKEGIIINPDITVRESQEVEDYLIDEAINKRNQLEGCFEEMGKNINPLLLIQLPNDGVTISSEDKTMRDQVISYLKEKYALTVDNGSVAVWLSDKADKQNLEGIEQPDSPVRVLLFKEAIAKGWDCPRAAVLLIFRKLQSNEFAIQTLGRILRMPEQKYYYNPLLNKGYVYTNISKDRIIVAGESEDYWKQTILTAYRRENLNNISLRSVYEYYSASDRNRLGPDFARFLCDYIKKHWLQSAVQMTLFGVDEDGNMHFPKVLPGMGEDIAANRQTVEAKYKIRFNVKGVTINIPKDLNIQNEESEIKIKDSVEYTRSNNKLYKIFLDYCRSLLTKYEKVASTPVLAGAIMEMMEVLFEVSEYDTPKVILSVKPVNNNHKFTDIFTRALDEYYEKVQERKEKAKERSFVPWDWTVPERRMYNPDKNEEIPEVEDHALMPFIRSNNASLQERNFETYLEDNAESIDWWYKNGDNGRMNYAVEYTDPSLKRKRLFYVDFIIRLNNGDIYLFDTKSEGMDAGMEAKEVLIAKHNALNQYVNDSKNPKLKAGSIIKFHGGAWRYCTFPITNLDTSGWSSFFPDQLTK